MMTEKDLLIEAVYRAIEARSIGAPAYGAAIAYEHEGSFMFVNSARNKNDRYSDKKKEHHAERQLFKSLKGQDLDYSKMTLFTSCEPCRLCYQEARDLGISRFVFGLGIETAISAGSSDEYFKLSEQSGIEVKQMMEEEVIELLTTTSPATILSHVSEGTQEEKKWMEYALKIAKEGMEQSNEIPVGVVLVKNGELLSESFTKTLTYNSPIIHGDIEALRLAERKVYDIPGELVMYSTLEPHLLGFGAAIKGKVHKVVYGMTAYPDGGSQFLKSMNTFPHTEETPHIVSGVMHKEQYELFKEFIEKYSDNRVGYSYVKKLVDKYEEIEL